MELVRKLETMLVEQYKKAPHLPVNGQKWLAENAWWIVLVGVVISVFAMMGVLSFLALAMFGLSLGGAMLGAGYGAAVGMAVGGVLFVTTLVALALYIVVAVLLGMAVSPLKAMKKRGWDLVFLVAVVNAVVVVVTNVLSADLVGLIFGLLWAAVGAYFLFEVRSRFVGTKPVAKPTKAGLKKV